MGDKMAMLRTYTETYDLNTEEGSPTVLAIHSPIGPTPYKMLAPAFKMYKKYKYLGCDVTIVNSARLPIDPEQVGRIDGQNYIDPRDVLNPILMRGCHGESLGKILDSMYNGQLNDSDDFHVTSVDFKKFKESLTNFYYTALGDDSWRKSNIQKTLQIKGLHPMVYSLSANHQILPTNSIASENYRENNPVDVTNPSYIGNTEGSDNGRFGVPFSNASTSPSVSSSYVFNPVTGLYEYKAGLLTAFTGRMHRLGWLDTYQFVGQNVEPTAPNSGGSTMIAQLPKIFMALVMLPPAVLVRQYLRVLVRHKFKFAQYRTITTGAGDAYDWNVDEGSVGYHYHFTGNIPDPNSKEADLREAAVLDDELIEGDDMND